MYVFDWNEIAQGQWIITAVHQVETLDDCPELPEWHYRCPEEKLGPISDINDNPFPITDVAVGWQAFPNDAQIIPESGIFIRPPDLPSEGAAQAAQ
jgi:hypothetical protein